MAIHTNFADWYRTAGVTPQDGLLDKRWAAIEVVAAEPKVEMVLGLATIFALPNATDAMVPEGFREAFRAKDENFVFKDNLHELRVLAGVTLRQIIEQKSAAASLASLALLCASFGTRAIAVPEAEHLEAAEKFLIAHGESIRKSESPTAIKSPTLTKARFTELLPQALFAQNNLPAIHEPLLNALTEIGAGISSGLKQTQKAIDVLRHSILVREEELNILWWLQTGFSRDLKKTFAEIGYLAGSLILPKEIADLTVFRPGPQTATAITVHALKLAGAPNVAEMATIAKATNATPKEWRELVSEQSDLKPVGLICPLLLAINKSLETDGPDDWLPVYRKICDVPVDKPFTLLEIANQIYRESMLLYEIASE